MIDEIWEWYWEHKIRYIMTAMGGLFGLSLYLMLSGFACSALRAASNIVLPKYEVCPYSSIKLLLGSMLLFGVFGSLLSEPRTGTAGWPISFKDDVFTVLLSCMFGLGVIALFSNIFSMRPAIGFLIFLCIVIFNSKISTQDGGWY